MHRIGAPDIPRLSAASNGTLSVDALRAARGQRACDGRGQCQHQKHNGCGAGKTRRAIERLQQYDGIRTRQESGDQIGELKFAD